ncbi:hypothetical protein [Hymenobacter properus]|uniref:Uncharacterized protein n=1 Tax=Hymenobacter properus TaxID=2791026 RepID=A0A931BM73_9BACT|nr:hypothetical protein [Hymenobacter properus]MBF9143891.1 hypothetical protein [Hymenobacter properus]MBR7722705.1 hypothetical protein [Microvirga sp. SRT04]
MDTYARVKWWRYVEGQLLIGQLLILLGFAWLAARIYYSAFYSYVPAKNEQWRCATGETIALLFTVLTTCYVLLLCLWQFGLMKRRLFGKHASIWSLISFTASLLPVVLLIYTFWKP